MDKTFVEEVAPNGVESGNNCCVVDDVCINNDFMEIFVEQIDKSLSLYVQIF